MVGDAFRCFQIDIEVLVFAVVVLSMKIIEQCTIGWEPSSTISREGCLSEIKQFVYMVDFIVISFLFEQGNVSFQ